MRRQEEFPKPEDIWTHYVRSDRALSELQSLLYRSLREQGSGAAPVSGFAGMIREDVDGALRAMKDELDAEVTLFLVASFEAILRTDFNRRCRDRKKDAPSVALRKLFKKTAEKARLPDILDVWGEHVGKPGAISRLKSLLHLRHWLAHGRYFREKSGLRHPAPHVALSIGKKALLLLPGLQTFGLDAL